MKVDPLMIAAGLTQMEGDLSEDAAKVMGIYAENFLRVGGHIDWHFWISLSEESKGVFLAAQERIDLERAILFGAATQGTSQIAAMARPIDGGAAETRLALTRAVDSAADRLNDDETEVRR